MPFSKRKTRRSPLQRLSDQRRSLALAGLAVGAVFSAAIVRRKRRGEDVPPEPTVQFEENVPPVEVAPVEAPPVVAEPELDPESDEESRPINAAAPIEPATGELSAGEASILAVLAQAGRADDDRTAIAVATSLERDAGEVAGVLRKLGAEGVVSGELQTSAGEEIWAVTERGVRRLGAQH
ncbi:MAG: hypothetical protein JST53_17470 [Actinobacteria bacterium]|nr:hypothetical protein [Actinomycetota bacterium]